MKVLILFAHPALAASRVQKKLLTAASSIDDVTIHHLYQHYPDFDIDIAYEQSLLARHDAIIFQHPFYWYSSPPIIKQWLDLVLTHGWAYGSEGNALEGKWCLNAISTGGPIHAYQENGYNRYKVNQFLFPYEQTARLCKMQYLPPFVVHGTHKLSDVDLQLHAIQYQECLLGITTNRFSKDELNSVQYLNHLVPVSTAIQS